MLSFLTLPLRRKTPACDVVLSDAAAEFLRLQIHENGASGQTCVLVSASEEAGSTRYSMRLLEAAQVKRAVLLLVKGVHLALDSGSLVLLRGIHIGCADGALVIADQDPREKLVRGA